MQSYLEVIGTGERIPVPDDPAGERAAVVAHPSFQRALANARRESAEGLTIPFDEAIAQLDAEYPLPPALARKPKGTWAKPASAGEAPKRGRPANGDYQGRFLVRMPSSVHRELVQRAAREHTTLNQLVLSYISRGLGADAGT